MILLALALGCGSFGLGGGGDAAGGDTAAGLSITALSPSWGRPDEDTPVTITGTGLDGAESVWFGRSEVSLTRVDASTLVVTAPAAGIETTVDVRVEGPDGEDTLPGGFTYANEAPPDDGGGNGGGSGASDGLVGGLLQFSLTQYACPTCYDPAPASIDVYAAAAFHSPTRGGWFDWLPAEGDCAVDPASDSPASNFLDGGEWVYLTSGSAAVALRAASDHVYSASGLDEADYVRSAGYDLSLPEGGTGLDSFEVTDVLTTPQSITELTPADILLTNPRDAFSARISRGGQAFTWSPYGGGGSFVVELRMYDSRSGGALGEIVCRGPDDGSLSVPGSALGRFPSGSLVEVGMHRYVIGTFDRPDDGSEVETLTTFGVIGTGSLQ